MKTLQCPACGAFPQNHRNCEYCGSLFVRYQDLDIPLTNILSEKGELIDFVFPGLENELIKNLSMQKLNNWIVTEVLYQDNVLVQVVASKGMEKMLQVNEISIPSISIHQPFESNTVEFNKFLSLSESNLFKYSHESEFHDYIIEFGRDAKGAAYLVSKILVQVYGVNSNAILNYSTTDYGYDNSIDYSTVNYDTEEQKIVPQKGNCFIATATMGDYDNPVVMDLRNFRDNWILKQNWGKDFVNFYYKYGQYPAKFIEHSSWRKKTSYYLIVRPLHMISKLCK